MASDNNDSNEAYDKAWEDMKAKIPNLIIKTMDETVLALVFKIGFSRGAIYGANEMQQTYNKSIEGAMK